MNKKAEVQDPEKAAEVIQKCENIIRTKKKGIIRITYHQGKVFKKFKDKEKLITLFSKLRIHKTTIIFKINVYKLCERHPKLLKSSIGLGFLKNHCKDIKEICMENAQEFFNHLLLSYPLFILGGNELRKLFQNFTNI